MAGSFSRQTSTRANPATCSRGAFVVGRLIRGAVEAGTFNSGGGPNGNHQPDGFVVSIEAIALAA